MPHVGALTKKGYIDLLEDEYLTMVIAEGGEALGKSAFMLRVGEVLWPGQYKPH